MSNVLLFVRDAICLKKKKGHRFVVSFLNILSVWRLFNDIDRSFDKLGQCFAFEETIAE